MGPISGTRDDLPVGLGVLYDYIMLKAPCCIRTCYRCYGFRLLVAVALFQRDG